MSGEYMGARLTVGIEGSFGILQYAFLALTGSSVMTGRGVGEQPGPCSLTGNMLERGFRRPCNSDFADIALKAQPADGSIRCHASTEGFVALWLDDTLAWSQRFEPEQKDVTLWFKAARTRDVTLISGDGLLIFGANVDPTAAAAKRTLVAGKIPTVWT